MRHKRTVRLLAACAALGMIAAACGDDDDDDSAADTTAAAGDHNCPAKIVIQTDWFPEAEHGGVYQLVGTGGTFDVSRQAYSGINDKYKAAFGATVPEFEIRAGGPAIGFEVVTATMQKDDSITFGFVSTDEGLQFSKSFPTLAVVAPLDINPQIIMWDPEEYPDVETIADLGKTDAKVLVFSDTSTFVLWFKGKGIVTNFEAGYDGSPARFVAEEGIAQQSFVSNEVYKYENEIAEYKRDVAFQLLDDAGYKIYSQPLVIRADRKAELDSCLKVVVPIVQQAIVDYMADPAPINSKLTEIVTEINDFWQISDALNADATQKMRDLGLVGNGPNSTIGDFDLDRVETVVEDLKTVFAEQGIESYDPDATAESIVTNEYINTSIKL